MTTVAPERPLTHRPQARSQGRPVPVRSLPAELLDVALDILPPEQETRTGPSDELLLRCSAVLGGIIAAALLAGEIVVRLV